MWALLSGNLTTTEQNWVIAVPKGPNSSPRGHLDKGMRTGGHALMDIIEGIKMGGDVNENRSEIVWRVDEQRVAIDRAWDMVCEGYAELERLTLPKSKRRMKRRARPNLFFEIAYSGLYDYYTFMFQVHNTTCLIGGRYSSSQSCRRGIKALKAATNHPKRWVFNNDGYTFIVNSGNNSALAKSTDRWSRPHLSSDKILPWLRKEIRKAPIRRAV